MEGIVKLAKEDQLAVANLRGFKSRCGNAGATTLAHVLKENMSIHSLLIDDCDITDVGMQHLLNTIAMNATLQSISIGGNDLSLECIEKFFSAVRSSAIRDISLSNAPQGTLDYFIKNAVSNNNIRTFDYSENRLSLEETQKIASMLKGEQGGIISVEHLNLSSCGLGDAGITALSEALPRCNTLKVLNIFENGITDEGGQRLLNQIRTAALVSGVHGGGMQKIILANNMISDELATEIAVAVVPVTETAPANDEDMIVDEEFKRQIRQALPNQNQKKQALKAITAVRPQRQDTFNIYRPELYENMVRELSATIIQANFRGFRMRRLLGAKAKPTTSIEVSTVASVHYETPQPNFVYTSDGRVVANMNKQNHRSVIRDRVVKDYAAVVIQAEFRRALAAKETKKHHVAKDIQRMYRGHRARKDPKIAALRSKRESKSRKSEFEDLNKAAMKIQSRARGYLQRQRTQPKPLVEEEEVIDPSHEPSAVKIQSAFRQRQAKTKVDNIRQQHAAATKVQSGFRGMQARKEARRRRFLTEETTDKHELAMQKEEIKQAKKEKAKAKKKQRLFSPKPRPEHRHMGVLPGWRQRKVYQGEGSVQPNYESQVHFSQSPRRPQSARPRAHGEKLTSEAEKGTESDQKTLEESREESQEVSEDDGEVGEEVEDYISNAKLDKNANFEFDFNGALVSQDGSIPVQDTPVPHPPSIGRQRPSTAPSNRHRQVKGVGMTLYHGLEAPDNEDTALTPRDVQRLKQAKKNTFFVKGQVDVHEVDEVALQEIDWKEIRAYGPLYGNDRKSKKNMKVQKKIWLAQENKWNYRPSCHDLRIPEYNSLLDPHCKVVERRLVARHVRRSRRSDLLPPAAFVHANRTLAREAIPNDYESKEKRAMMAKKKRETTGAKVPSLKIPNMGRSSASQYSGRSQTARASTRASTSQLDDPMQDTFDLSCKKLEDLWDSTMYPEDERQKFRDSYFGERNPISTAKVLLQVDQFQRLVNKTEEIYRAIHTREQLLEILESDRSSDELKKEASDQLADLSELIATEITEWKKVVFWNEYGFLYNGKEYSEKIREDAERLAPEGGMYEDTFEQEDDGEGDNDAENADANINESVDDENASPTKSPARPRLTHETLACHERQAKRHMEVMKMDAIQGVTEEASVRLQKLKVGRRAKERMLKDAIATNHRWTVYSMQEYRPSILHLRGRRMGAPTTKFSK